MLFSSPLLSFFLIITTQTAPILTQSQHQHSSMAVEAQHLHLFDATSTWGCVGNQSTCNYDLVGLVENSPVVFADGYAVVDPSSASCVSTSKRPRDTDEDVDNCLVAQHVERIRAEMAEGRIRFARQVIALFNDRACKRLRAKDEEIEQMKKLNWALEDKMKTIVTENQVWQYLAQTNEAAANALRANLEHVLQAQQVGLGEQRLQAAAAADDAESCCGDNFEDWDVRKEKKHLCRSCSVREPSVLLLPCRHLCLCAACARAADACPICKCGKTGSVNLNLS